MEQTPIGPLIWEARTQCNLWRVLCFCLSIGSAWILSLNVIAIAVTSTALLAGSYGLTFNRTRPTKTKQTKLLLVQFRAIYPSICGCRAPYRWMENGVIQGKAKSLNANYSKMQLIESRATTQSNLRTANSRNILCEPRWAFTLPDPLPRRTFSMNGTLVFSRTSISLDERAVETFPPILAFVDSI